MNISLKLTLVAITVAFVIVISCSRPQETGPADSLVGEEVIVQFSKDLWTCCLEEPEYIHFFLKSADENKMCFIDPSTVFVEENAERLNKEGVDWTKITDDTFCISTQHISALKQNGKIVWGTGTANPEEK